jgi:Heterokaryon incompatibility protein (HET)
MKRHAEYPMEKERPATPQLNREGCQLSYRDIISNGYSGKIQRDQYVPILPKMDHESDGTTDGEYSSKSFSYDKAPLTEDTRKTHIRLVHPCRAEPGEFCYSFELKSVPLDDSPIEFIALSYTWGEDGPSFPITLNGQKLFITMSLAKALYYIYSNRATRPIWIDQISIDQSNKDEKNFQVPLMSKIYSKANEVLIWLGESADGSDELMDALSFAGSKSCLPERTGRSASGGVPVWIKTTARAVDPLRSSVRRSCR